MSYLNAWYLCHRLREVVDEDDDEDGARSLLEGPLKEAEMRVGVKQTGVGGGIKEDEVTVTGVVERDGRARMYVGERPQPEAAPLCR